MPSEPSLDLDAVRNAYVTGTFRPVDLLDRLGAAIEGDATPGIWIHRVPRDELLAAGRALEERLAAGARMPLYGVPFAVKDNIDVEGMPTTVACPDFSYVAASSAPVVTRLIDAGAVLVGKTNLDQFATGLVGVRSPYGIPPNPFDARYISGGSSSGSAAAVTRGHVSFALGTDTAGSGRIPASLNNLVGLKPSRGLLSTRGVFPACRSLDCVSIFGLTCDDAREVARVATAYDPSDAYSRPEADRYGWQAPSLAAGFRFGIPDRGHREFFGDRESERLFEDAVARLEALGGRPEEVDLAPFVEAGQLLYGGPWVAERLSAIEEFVSKAPSSVLPVIREIVGKGAGIRATETYRAMHRLAALQQIARRVFRSIAFLVVPTAPTAYLIDEVLANPIVLNSRLGLYASFVNLLDLAAVSVPGGFRADGIPSGVTLVGPWGNDAELLAAGSAFHERVGSTMGATGRPLPATKALPDTPQGTMRLAVVGAHLSGEPLNSQLTTLGARRVRACSTASRYRLYALAGGPPARPGLVQAADGGSAIEVEVWELERAAFGAFFANVPAPLCIGTVELEDGERVAGFLCEPHGLLGATDISAFGGWRRYRAKTST